MPSSISTSSSSESESDRFALFEDTLATSREFLPSSLVESESELSESDEESEKSESFRGAATALDPETAPLGAGLDTTGAGPLSLSDSAEELDD